MRYSQLEVAGAFAADAVRIGDGEIVMRMRPVDGSRRARPSLKRKVEAGDRSFEVVGVLALRACQIGAAEREGDVGADALAGAVQWPGGKLCYFG